MTKNQLIKELDDLEKYIEDSIVGVEDVSLQVQNEFYEYILKTVSRFDTEAGRFIVNQDISDYLGRIETKFQKIIDKTYKPNIRDYLSTFKTIEETTQSLHKSYQYLEIETELLSPARKTVYNQAKKYLGTGLNDAYLQPAKYLLMQQVTSGISIKDSQKVLKEWNNGKRVGTISPVPNLAKYTTQIARDSSYGLSRSINSVIADEFKLTSFIYSGAILRDSRPLCVHLVNLRRDIELEEMPPLIKKYPAGLKPDTSKENFMQVAGGWNCNHTCFPVK